jgi:hypothetical protein
MTEVGMMGRPSACPAHASSQAPQAAGPVCAGGGDSAAGFLFGGALWDVPTAHPINDGPGAEYRPRSGDLPPLRIPSSRMPVGDRGSEPGACDPSVRIVGQPPERHATGDARVCFGDLEIRVSRSAAAQLAHMVSLAPSGSMATAEPEVRILAHLLREWSR